jgi:hypothetical protein
LRFSFAGSAAVLDGACAFRSAGFGKGDAIRGFAADSGVGFGFGFGFGSGFDTCFGFGAASSLPFTAGDGCASLRGVYSSGLSITSGGTPEEGLLTAAAGAARTPASAAGVDCAVTAACRIAGRPPGAISFA